MILITNSVFKHGKRREYEMESSNFYNGEQNTFYWYTIVLLIVKNE